MIGQSIRNMLALGLGVFIGIWGGAVFFLPLFYGFPRALFDAVRGRAPKRAPLMYLIPLVSWGTLLFALGYFGATYAPRLIAFLTLDPAVAIGQWLGLGGLFIRSLMPVGRRELDADYSRKSWMRAPVE